MISEARNVAGARRGRSVGAVLGLLLLLPLVGCATKADVRDLREEIRELNSRQEALLRELQRQGEAQGDSIRVLAEDFRSHQGRVAGQFRNLEDLVLRTEELAGISQQEIAAIRDQMEVPRRGVPGGERSDLDDPFGGGAEESYEQAISLLRRGSTTAARMGFQGVVEQYPNHPLAPEARYHLADILVQEGNLEEAIHAFQRIGELHPGADRVPDAYYRVGALHRELGSDSEARSWLERVVNTWPDSGAADLARELLREIG